MILNDRGHDSIHEPPVIFLLIFESMEFIDFLDRKLIKNKFEALQPHSIPIFGMMTPQHMVEHLSLVLTISNGKRDVTQVSPNEKIPFLIKFLEGPEPLPKGFKAPFISKDILPALTFKDMETSLDRLYSEIDGFEKFYEAGPTVKKIHPVFGPLDKRQWIIFHNKHFTHHLKQFDLY